MDAFSLIYAYGTWKNKYQNNSNQNKKAFETLSTFFNRDRVCTKLILRLRHGLSEWILVFEMWGGGLVKNI